MHRDIHEHSNQKCGDPLSCFAFNYDSATLGVYLVFINTLMCTQIQLYDFLLLVAHLGDVTVKMSMRQSKLMTLPRGPTLQWRHVNRESQVRITVPVLRIYQELPRWKCVLCLSFAVTLWFR